MDALVAYSRLANYIESISDPDEFIPQIISFTKSLSYREYFYFSFEPDGSVNIVFNNRVHRLDSARRPIRKIYMDRKNECLLLDGRETVELFGGLLSRFLPEGVTGYSSYIPIACTANREAHLLLLGAPTSEIHKQLEKYQILQLIGVECDRHFRKLTEFQEATAISLSLQERRCLVWASQGKSMDEIAVIIGIKRRTVEYHMTNARQKLGAGNLTQAVYRATKAGILI